MVENINISKPNSPENNKTFCRKFPKDKHENGKLPSGLSAFEISSNNKRSISNISPSLFSIRIIDRPRRMSFFIFHYFKMIEAFFKN
jgi:hypothetical protein